MALSSNKNVLITGGTGFLGKACAEAFSRAGYTVFSAGGPSSSRGIPLDIHSTSSISSALEKSQPAFLVHLAWYMEHGRYWDSEENDRWVESSEQLFRAFAAKGGKRLLVAGTCAEYRWGGDTDLSEDHSSLEPSSRYGQAKLALNRRLPQLCDELGLSFAWARLFYLYGPGEFRQRWLPNLIRAFLTATPPPQAQGYRLRDLTYVSDAAEGFVALAGSFWQGTLNLASGRATRLDEVIELAAKASGASAEARASAVLPGSAAGDDQARITAKVKLQKEVLDWSPPTCLAEGIERTVAYWRPLS